jgi:hypothetical protein
MLLLPALNAMIDISSTRTVALQTHQPMLVFVMLAISMLASALVAGFDMESGTRSWAHVICFTVQVTIAYFVILDLEYPRLGLIRIDWMDQTGTFGPAWGRNARRRRLRPARPLGSAFTRGRGHSRGSAGGLHDGVFIRGAEEKKSWGPARVT